MKQPNRPDLIALIFLIGALPVVLRAQEAVPANNAPKCHFQILNGISPGPIDIYLDGKLIFPASPPGQRISSIGWPKNKFELRLVDAKSGREIKQNIKLPEGAYTTLILAGDFETLPGQKPLKPDGPPPVRATVQVFSNKLDGGESSVRVRFMNSFVDRSITVKSRNGKSWTIAPMSMTSASGLSGDLYLQAILGDNTQSLYLAQEPPAENISIVFFPSKESFGFRAMVETLPK